MTTNRPIRLKTTVLTALILVLLAATVHLERFPGVMLTRSSTNEAAASYLPVIRKDFPPAATVFGSEFTGKVQPAAVQLAAAAGNYWVRAAFFDWSEIEATPGTYNWEAVDEAGIRNIHASGMQIIAIVYKVPEWAQHPRGRLCGPIDESAFGAFAAFLNAAVSRYKGSIQYWELGNEPDIDPQLMLPDMDFFGCWGDETDPYYGGRAYAQMLRAAYPAVKSADPNAQVLIGGLLLDCDPTNPPPEKSCLPAKFFEGILVGGAANDFDIVSFHAYPFYFGDLSNDRFHPHWSARGGIVMGKVSYLKQVMAAYGISKPLLHSEGGLLCHPTTPGCDDPGADFYEAQADYVPRLYLRAWGEGLMGTIWYTFTPGGWRFGELLAPGNLPRPSYHAYAFMTSLLRNAEYLDRIMQHDGNLNVRGYRFQKNGTVIWAVWSEDETPVTITLPVGTLQAYDKYGNILTPHNNEVTISSPIYLQILP
jgi:hypothetical protein